MVRNEAAAYHLNAQDVFGDYLDGDWASSKRVWALLCPGGAVRLVDADDGRELLRVAPCPSVGALAALTDMHGDFQNSGTSDRFMPIVWEAPVFPPLYGSAAFALLPRDLDALWHGLGSRQVTTVLGAMAVLIGAGDQATTHLDDRLQSMPPAFEHDAERLAAELDDERYAVREAATRLLMAQAEDAEPVLMRLLAGNPTLEVRARVVSIFQRLTDLRSRGIGFSAKRQRRSAIAVLERIGTPEALHVLQSLARNAQDPAIWLETRTALDRLASEPRPHLH